MKKLKVAVYGIAKNEQEFVERFMDSCSNADVVVVGVDPGDTTGDILESRGARVVRIDLPKFRFDAYRNEVLMHLPSDIDVCVSLDLDEVLPDGWRDLIELDWVDGTTRLTYSLQWSPDRCFQYDRIHARHGYTWRHANHEAVYAIRKCDEVISKSRLTISHLPDWSKDRSKNLSLLEYAVEEDKHDTRMRFYLLREYYYVEEYGDCIEEAQEYMQLKPGWAEERAWACIFCARAYDALDRPMDALAWLNWAVRTAPIFRDPLMELASYHYENREIEMAKEEMERVFAIEGYSEFFESNGAYDEGRYILMAKVWRGSNDNRSDQCIRRAKRMSPDNVEIDKLIEEWS